MRITNEAYLAGFFDGEGCVSILYDRRHRSYTLTLAIAQHSRNISVLETLQSLWGGNLYVYETMAHLIWNGQQAKPIILAMLANSIVKRPQLEVALEFIALMPGAGKNHPSKNLMRYLRTKITRLKRAVL